MQNCSIFCRCTSKCTYHCTFNLSYFFLCFDQMMWMRIGMAPLMFPGVQHYMSRLGMGIGPLAMPSIHNQMHLSRLPLVDQATTPNQSAVYQTAILNPINYHTQLQNYKFSEQYANYTALHPLQRSPSFVTFIFLFFN